MSHYKRSIRRAIEEAGTSTFVEGTEFTGQNRESRRHVRHPQTGKVFNIINSFSHMRRRWNRHSYSWLQA